MADSYVIVFHSLPSKPCIDGVIAAFISVAHILEENPQSNILFVPHLRTSVSFRRLCRCVNYFSRKNSSVNILYLDVTPSIPEEIEYLVKLRNTGTVFVEIIDHHPTFLDSMLSNGGSSFRFRFDSDRCAAMMVGAETMKVIPGLRNLLILIQFSEYECMKPSLSHIDEARNVCRNILQKHISFFNSNDDVIIYFVLDTILSSFFSEEKWNFLYDPDLSDSSCANLVLNSYRTIFPTLLGIFNYSSFPSNPFSIEHQEEYESKVSRLENVLRHESIMVTIPNHYFPCIDHKKEGSSVILVMYISIYSYGRVVEPVARKEMELRGAQYGIYVNPVSNSISYLSIRRVRPPYSAKDLAEAIKVVTGSDVGGGHVWASAVSLDSGQYEVFNTFIKEHSV